VYLYVLDTAPCITEPQVVVSITGKKSWLNLCLCVCIAGTKNALFASQRDKTSLHDVLTFLSKFVNKITVFSKREDNDSR
jgi:hypothetical protein